MVPYCAIQRKITEKEELVLRVNRQTKVKRKLTGTKRGI